MSFYYVPTATPATPYPSAAPFYWPSSATLDQPNTACDDLNVDIDDAIMPYHPWHRRYPSTLGVSAGDDPLDAQERAAIAQLKAVQAERVRRQQREQQEQQRLFERQQRIAALELARQQEQRQQQRLFCEQQRQQAERELHQRQRQAAQQLRAQAIAARYERELAAKQLQAQAQAAARRQQEQQARLERERQRELQRRQQRLNAARHQQLQRQQAQEQSSVNPLEAMLASLFAAGAGVGAPFWVQFARDQDGDATDAPAHQDKNGQQKQGESSLSPSAAAREGCCGRSVPCCKTASTSAPETEVAEPKTATANDTTTEATEENKTTGADTTSTEPKLEQHHPLESLVKDFLGAFLGPQAAEQVKLHRVNQQDAGQKEAQNEDSKSDKKGSETTSTPDASTSESSTQLEKEVANEIDQALDGLFGAFKAAFGAGEEGETQTAKEQEQHESTVKVDKGKARAEDRQDTNEAEVADATPAPTTADDIPESAAHLAAEREQSAAELIQQQYRRHLNRVRRLEKLEALERKLNKLDAGFTFPEHLDFADPEDTTSNGTLTPQDPVDGASSASGDDVSSLAVPPLAFTPTNQSYHHHAQSLLSLLVSADTISSDGDKDVRQSRKDFVKRVEGKLAEMEKMRRQVWERQQSKGDKRAEGVEGKKEEVVEKQAPVEVGEGVENVPAPAESSQTSSFSDSETEEEEEKKEGYEMI